MRQIINKPISTEQLLEREFHRVNAVVSYYGTLIGRAKGEAFLMKVPPEVQDPVDFIQKQGPRRLR